MRKPGMRNREGRKWRPADSLTGVWKMAGCLILVGMLCIACSSASRSPGASTQRPVPSPSPSSAFQTSIQTTDKIFLLNFSVTPNRYGINQFTLNVNTTSNGEAATHEFVQIFATMLDMDMGTALLILPARGNGRYSASGEFVMDGNWEIGIQIQDTHVHVARLKLYTPA